MTANTREELIEQAVAEWTTSPEFQRAAIEYVAYEAEPDDLPRSLIGIAVRTWTQRNRTHVVEEALGALVDYDVIGPGLTAMCVEAFERSDDYRTTLEDIEDCIDDERMGR